MALPRRTGADPIAAVAPGRARRERVRPVHGRLVAGLAACRPARRRARRARRCRAGTWSSTRAPRPARAPPDSVAQLPLPGWTVESTFTAVQYGAPGFLTAADSTALGGGVNFFAGGPGGATSAATQVVDVSGAAAGDRCREGRGDALGAARRLLRRRPITRRGHGDVPERRRRRAGGAIALPAVTPDRPQLGDRADRPVRLGAGAGGHPPDLGAHRRHPRGGLLQRRLHRQRQPRARLRSGRRRSSTRPSWSRSISGKVRVRRPGSTQFVDLTGTDGIPLGSTVDTLRGRRGAHLAAPRRAARRSPAQVLRGRLQGHADRLGHEPRAHRAAGLVPRRRPQRARRRRRSSATSGATARARSARPASTARPPSAARSGSSRTAAPAP